MLIDQLSPLPKARLLAVGFAGVLVTSAAYGPYAAPTATAHAAVASQTIRVGLATARPADWRTLSARLGGVSVRRSYSTTPTGAPPSTYVASAAGIDPSLGATTSVASFKSDPIKTAQGAYDSQLKSLAKSSPAGTNWVYWHEPEGPTDMPGATDAARAGVFTAAAYHVVTTMKAANPRLVFGVVFTRGLWGPAAGHDPIRWTSYKGRTLPVDFIGVDGYNSYDINGRPWASPETVYQRSLDWIDANRGGWDKQVTELGSTADPSNPARRAQWITNAYRYLNSRNVTIASYWSNNAYDIQHDAPAIAALRSINTSGH